MLLTAPLAILAGCNRHTGPPGPQGNPGPGAQIVPDTVLTLTNINPNDITAGPEGRALLILNVDSDELYNFPFTTIAGGPVYGQSQHTAIAPDKRTVYVTMGGDDTLPLRLLIIDLDWLGGILTPTVTDTLELIPAGGTTQQAHGLAFTSDGLFLTFSEFQNQCLRVLDTQTKQLVGLAVHPSLIMPHGLYPNPNATLAVSTQYSFEQNEVSIWNMYSTGVIDFDKTVTLADLLVLGAYTHTVVWLDNTRFYTDCTQETTQGSGNFQRSVWLIDAVAGTATAVLDNTVLLEGVSDLAIANGKLYVAEGNVETGDPGNLSIWSIADPLNPVFVKQLSAGSGFPSDFLSDTHGLFATADEKFVFVSAFRSNHLIKVNTLTDNVVRVYDGSDGLSLPHGMFINY